MIRFQILCPHCESAASYSENEQVTQASCANCGVVIPIMAPPGVAHRFENAELEIITDNRVDSSGVNCYFKLAGHGISTQSTMAAIQKVFPNDDAESEAGDTLALVRTRLAVDLMLFPIWSKTPEAAHES